MCDHEGVWLYTDASICGDAQASGWGAVLVIDGVEIASGSGLFEKHQAISDLAEICAAGYALRWTAQNNLIPSGSAIRLSCDNRLAVEIMNGKEIKRPRKRGLALVSAKGSLVGHLRKNGAILKAAIWVKGHQPLGQSSAADFNRKADRLARNATGAGGAKRRRQEAFRLRKTAEIETREANAHD